MIDIHNHVLYGVDDGPRDIEETVNLLTQAKEEEVTGIFVTPHHLHPMFPPISYDDIEKKIETLKKHPIIQELDINFYPGQEIRLTDELFEGLKDGSIKGLNHTRYLLLELPSKAVPLSTNQIIFEIQRQGYVPIIVHPERNEAIAGNLEILFNLINAGAYSQLTSMSLSGALGRTTQKVSMDILDNHLAHFIASDAHHSKTRPFLLKGLFHNKKLEPYQKDLKIMLNNNAKLTYDEPVDKKQPNLPKKKRFFGLF